MSVRSSVDTLLNSIDLDEVGGARAEIARMLASKLDEISASETATSAMAAPNVAKELRAILNDILNQRADDDDFHLKLFGPES